MVRPDRVVLLLALVVTAGCNCVRVDQPFGAPVDAMQLKSLAGKWVDDDGGVVELRLDHQGRCVAGTMDWSMKSDKFEAQTEVIEMRQLAGRLVGFIRADKGYYFAWIEVDRHRLNVYLPDTSQFKKAIQMGIIQRSISGDPNDKELILVANSDLAEWMKQPHHWNVAFKGDEAVEFRPLAVAGRTEN